MNGVRTLVYTNYLPSITMQNCRMLPYCHLSRFPNDSQVLQLDELACFTSAVVVMGRFASSSSAITNYVIHAVAYAQCTCALQ
jgi:hypothetical protein